MSGLADVLARSTSARAAKIRDTFRGPDELGRVQSVSPMRVRLSHTDTVITSSDAVIYGSLPEVGALVYVSPTPSGTWIVHGSQPAADSLSSAQNVSAATGAQSGSGTSSIDPSASPGERVVQAAQMCLPHEVNGSGLAKSGYIFPGGASGVLASILAQSKSISDDGKPYGPSAHGLDWAAARRAPNQDCSSSTSLALYAGGLMSGQSGPVVSDFFLGWGLPGKGKAFTVWVRPGTGSAGHVWIEFYAPRYARFDTGWHSGVSGARLVTSQRSTSGFIPRHWRGL